MQEKLLQHQDISYRDFHSKLIPNINKELIIGVRTPVIRGIASKVKNTNAANEFLKSLPHKYYEENNLHALIICENKDFNTCICQINEFLPYIDNWATCDMLRPKIVAENKEAFLLRIYEWLKTDKEYTLRFAIEMLMVHFLDKSFKEEYLMLVASVKNEAYYVKMAVAWYFAEALAKQHSTAIKYIENKNLNKWCHNKAIQKACESFRINSSAKAYLKTLKY